MNVDLDTDMKQRMEKLVVTWLPELEGQIKPWRLWWTTASRTLHAFASFPVKTSIGRDVEIEVKFKFYARRPAHKFTLHFCQAESRRVALKQGYDKVLYQAVQSRVKEVDKPFLLAMKGRVWD